MNRMLGMARVLLQAGLPREQQRLAREICGSGEVLLRLVNDAVDYAESETGDRAPGNMAFDLRLLVDEIAGWLRLRAADKGVTVEYRVHHEVPSRLVGDAGRVRQVVWNLGASAMDALQTGGLVLRIGRVHENLGSVTLRFDLRWYRSSEMGKAGAERDPASPTPIGEVGDTPASDSDVRLCFARRLAALIGGTVVTEGEPDGRTHAWVDLTFSKQAEPPPDETAVAPRESLAGSRVLLASPEGVMRRSMAGTLEAWGCRTSEVARAQEALTLVREASAAGDPFRFALIGRELPLEGADELATQLREGTAGATPHLILLVAAGCRGDLERARSSGFAAYLPVPIDWQELADALVEVERLAASAPADAERPLVTRHWLAELRRSRTRLLIVEDDLVSALVTDWTLRRMGYQVRRVGTAAEMRLVLEAAPVPFDLVILALRLPDADGLSLVAEIQGHVPEGRHVTIVSIGYLGTRVERERCHASGVDAYIASPVDLAHLCEIVERITKTNLAYGPEAEGLTDGASSVRQRAQSLGMITFQFEVDSTTGIPLSRGAGVDVSGLAEMVPATMFQWVEGSGATLPAAGAAAGVTPDAAAIPSTGVPESPEPALAGGETDPGGPMALPDAPQFTPSAGEEPVAEGPPTAAGGETDPGGPTASVEPERPAEDEARQVLDFERLNLTSMGNAVVRSHLLGLFIEQARAGLIRLEQAIVAGDTDTAVSETDHMTKISETVGAVTCAESFAAMHRQSPARLTAEAAPLLSNVWRELDRLERVRSLLGPGQPTDDRAVA